MAAVEKTPSVTSETRTGRKKKAKADVGANGSIDTVEIVPADASKDNPTTDAENAAESSYVRELQKHIRGVNKKLSALQKIDAIIAENQGVSLDELVKQRKINADQKASAEKKPFLQAQHAQLEEQIELFRKFEIEHQAQLKQQREELLLERQMEVESVKAELQIEAVGEKERELREKLLVFSQFLRAAAQKRTMEEEADTDLNMAFEGVLLLVYGGDQKAVDTALSLITGTSESVPDVDGNKLPVLYSQIKQASINYAPVSNEVPWNEQIAEAGFQDEETGVDPTIANAGLTELQLDGQSDALTNGAAVTEGASGNVAGERWDATAAGTAGEGNSGGMEDSYEIIPRPADEVDNPVTLSQQPQSTRWDEEPPTYEAATGNKAGEQWDLKVPGEQADDTTWASDSVQVAESIKSTAEDGAAPIADDGFHEVAGRQRGRGGGRGRGGDGEYRGRGGRRGHFRGGRGGNDGEFRGRGGFRGARGAQGDAGSGGRGRGRGGPRGGVPNAPAGS